MSAGTNASATDVPESEEDGDVYEEFVAINTDVLFIDENLHALYSNA